jgi:competence protein ComEC
MKYLLLSILLLLGACAKAPSKLRFEMLDAGQGLAFLVNSHGCATLYDVGDVEAGIDTMLINRNIDTLCSVIISHWHADHAGGLRLLAKMAEEQKLNIKRLVVSPDEPLKGAGLKLRESIFKNFARIEIPVREVYRGDTIGDFLPFKARILWPPPDDSSLSANSASLTLHLSDGKKGFLFTGDLEKEQEAVLMSLEPSLKVYYLQVGHHGSRTSSSLIFLQHIQPKMVFIGVGKDNKYRHPHPEILNRLYFVLQDSSKIFRTDILGSVQFEWIYGK